MSIVVAVMLVHNISIANPPSAVVWPDYCALGEEVIVSQGGAASFFPIEEVVLDTRVCRAGCPAMERIGNAITRHYVTSLEDYTPQANGLTALQEAVTMDIVQRLCTGCENNKS